MKTYNELRKELDLSRDECIETMRLMRDGETDFETGGFRFIHRDAIDAIMCDELTSDTYVLGCCSAWFIADMTELDTTTIEKAQAAGSYELLGRLLENNIENVQQGIVSNDGYGPHFATYDGEEHEVSDYFAFRN